MKIKTLLLIFTLILNSNQGYAAAAETTRRGPNLCVRLAMVGAAILASTSGSEAADPALRAHQALTPDSEEYAETRFSSAASSAGVKQEIYIKAMVDTDSATRILSKLDSSAATYATTNGAKLLTAPDLHMTMSKLGVHEFDKKNKKFITAACKAWYAVKDVAFTISGASSGFGRWVVLTLTGTSSPEFEESPHVSILRSDDSGVREDFMKKKFDWKSLKNKKVKFDSVTVGPNNNEVKIKESDCKNVPE